MRSNRNIEQLIYLIVHPYPDPSPYTPLQAKRTAPAEEGSVRTLAKVRRRARTVPVGVITPVAIHEGTVARFRFFAAIQRRMQLP